AGLTPAGLPGGGGRPGAAAHRPLPSMMTPTWIPAYAGVECEVRFIVATLSAFPRSADEGLHMIEIPLQRPTSGRRDHILGLRHATLERLLAQHVFGFL